MIESRRTPFRALLLGLLWMPCAGDITAQGEPPGSSRIVGVVVEDDTGAHVQSVAITLPGRQTLTNAEGRFAFDDISPGTYALRAHHLAYGSFSRDVEVPWRSTVNVEIRLAIDPVDLEPIRVTVTEVRDRRLELKGFYERREWGEKLGIGHFFDREDIERRNPVLMTHMVDDVPSVRLDCSRSYRARTCDPVSRRTSPLYCITMNVYVDGALVLRGGRDVRTRRDSTTHLDEMVNPSDVGAMEVYTSASELPAEYGGSSGQCGAVVIWTR